MGLEKRICIACGKEYKAVISSKQKYHSSLCFRQSKKKREDWILHLPDFSIKFNFKCKKSQIIPNEYIKPLTNKKKEINWILHLPNFSIIFVQDPSSQKIQNGTKPERIFYEYLQSKGLEESVDFKCQYHILNYFVDFYIPKLNLGIEVDGDYWHANPKKYGPNDILKMPTGKIKAKEIWKKDKIRENRIKEKIKLERFWEQDILNESYKNRLNSILDF